MHNNTASSYQIFVLCQSFDMSKQCPKICFEMSNVFGHPTRTTANLDVCSIYMVYLCLMRLMPILPQWAKTRKKDFILFVRTFTLSCIPICLKNAADQYALIYATRTISILKLWSLPIWLFYRFVCCAVEWRRPAYYSLSGCSTSIPRRSTFMMAKLNKITTKCWAPAEQENLWVAPHSSSSPLLLLPKLEAIQVPTITMASPTPT